jgi:hypothetical protein
VLKRARARPRPRVFSCHRLGFREELRGSNLPTPPRSESPFLKPSEPGAVDFFVQWEGINSETFVELVACRDRSFRIMTVACWQTSFALLVGCRMEGRNNVHIIGSLTRRRPMASRARLPARAIVPVAPRVGRFATSALSGALYMLIDIAVRF